MTDTDTTTAADNIHRTPALDKMGLARCRKDNKVLSWRKGGSCKVCGARVEDAPTAPSTAPTVKPKRARGAAPAAAREASVVEPIVAPEVAAAPVKDSKRKRNGSAAAASGSGSKCLWPFGPTSSRPNAGRFVVVGG